MTIILPLTKDQAIALQRLLHSAAIHCREEDVRICQILGVKLLGAISAACDRLS